MQPSTAQPKPLSGDLREIRDLFRRYVGSHQRPTIDACRELYVALNVMAEKADVLEERAAVADELEAVARDLDLVASAHASPSLQEALKRDQRALQDQLDRGDDGRDRGLAQLSAPIGESNVVTFPVVPRPAISRVDCQGEGGDAA
ncbi:MAG TPA: hypothetical protein VGV17_24085 [Bosea sp. (in: a-proteobacteria)]|uniref:hypothetical protein n=1 Tax=Bosea sp. (in: a-proteobacteria) TaxID=1871050 RepID=UPI002DDD9399|nr:hypothetical protein [Bosea sp. (in: a-proteobacteria)]HEV2556843.1 hypothetical protein [Bosea sp. (in: a-proteobacteria)]